MNFLCFEANFCTLLQAPKNVYKKCDNKKQKKSFLFLKEHKEEKTGEVTVYAAASFGGASANSALRLVYGRKLQKETRDARIQIIKHIWRI